MSLASPFEGGVRRSDQAYRRGLVLGLTMAEIVVLIIFSLLLALAALLTSKDEAIEQQKSKLTELQTALDQKNEEIVLLEQHIKSIAKADGVNDFDDMFKELRLAREREARANLQIAALEERTRSLDEVEKALSQTPVAESGSLEEQILELVQNAEAARELKDLLSEQGLPTDDPTALDEQLAELKAAAENQDPEKVTALAEENDDLRQELAAATTEMEQLREEFTEASKKLAGIGKGTEMPACWMNEETAKPEYIFNVALTSEGFVLRDGSPEHRRQEMKALPISEVQYDKEMGARDFTAVTRPLFDWSVANECRFFVRVFDLTGPTEKRIYKRHLRFVEQHFYKYEVLDEAFGGVSTSAAETGAPTPLIPDQAEPSSPPPASATKN